MKLSRDLLRNFFLNFAVSRKLSEFRFKKMDLSPQSIENHVTLVSGYLFDSCHLTLTWMSNTKLNTEDICLGLLASKCAISHPPR